MYKYLISFVVLCGLVVPSARGETVHEQIEFMRTAINSVPHGKDKADAFQEAMRAYFEDKLSQRAQQQNSPEEATPVTLEDVPELMTALSITTSAESYAEALSRGNALLDMFDKFARMDHGDHCALLYESAQKLGLPATSSTGDIMIELRTQFVSLFNDHFAHSLLGAQVLKRWQAVEKFIGVMGNYAPEADMVHVAAEGVKDALIKTLGSAHRLSEVEGFPTVADFTKYFMDATGRIGARLFANDFVGTVNGCYEATRAVPISTHGLPLKDREERAAQFRAAGYPMRLLRNADIVQGFSPLMDNMRQLRAALNNEATYIDLASETAFRSVMSTGDTLSQEGNILKFSDITLLTSSYKSFFESLDALRIVAEGHDTFLGLLEMMKVQAQFLQGSILLSVHTGNQALLNATKVSEVWVQPPTDEEAEAFAEKNAVYTSALGQETGPNAQNLQSQVLAKLAEDPEAGATLKALQKTQLLGQHSQLTANIANLVYLAGVSEDAGAAHYQTQAVNALQEKAQIDAMLATLMTAEDWERQDPDYVDYMRQRAAEMSVYKQLNAIAKGGSMPVVLACHATLAAYYNQALGYDAEKFDGTNPVTQGIVDKVVGSVARFVTPARAASNETLAAAVTPLPAPAVPAPSRPADGDAETTE